MGVIEEIKSRIDIVDFIGRDTKLERKGTSLVGLCPLPGHSERTPSFNVNADRQTFKCFGEGCRGNKGGDIIDYVEMSEGVDKDGAIQILCDQAGIDRTHGKELGRKFVRRPGQAREIVTDHMHKALMSYQPALDWFHDRQITDDDLRRWRVGIATDDMIEAFSATIPVETLLRIGVADTNRTDEGKPIPGGRVWQYIKSGVITFPVISVMGRVGFWHFKFWNPELGDPYQMKAYQRETETIFYNQRIFADPKLTEFFLVEGPFEVIQLERRGYRAIAMLGTHSGKQIQFLKDLRTRNPYFPELETSRTINIWLDRDEKLGGQKGAKQIADELYPFHRTVVWSCPKMGQDPDDFLRAGGEVEQVRKDSLVVSQRSFRIEDTKEGMMIHKAGESQRISDFRMKFKFRYREEETGNLIRIAEVSQNGGPRVTGKLAPSNLNRRDSLQEWLIGRGPYNFYGGQSDWDEAREFLFATDQSKTIVNTEHYGEVYPRVWIWDDGGIVDGKIVRMDSDRVIWVNRGGIEGVMTCIAASENIERQNMRMRLPESFLPSATLVREMLKFYPPKLVRISLGYLMALLHRTAIYNHYRSFVIAFYAGETGHGKTKLVELMQSLVGATGVPSDSCDSTSKAFMAHMTAYHNLPVALTEYDEKFQPYLKNIYDGFLYSKKKKTIRDETYDPMVNSGAVVTCERIPNGRSLINRTVYLDFNKFEYDRRLQTEYEAFWAQAVSKQGGFGFIADVLAEDRTDSVLRFIDRLKGRLVERNTANGATLESRIILNHAVIYGAWIALCHATPEIYKAFCEVEGDMVPVERLMDEINEEIGILQSLSRSQGMLEAFFSMFQSCYYGGKMDDYVKVDMVGDTIKFHLDAVVNEVIAYDRRGRNCLPGVKRQDIEVRIRREFGEVAVAGDMVELPLADLRIDYNVSFQRIGAPVSDGNDSSRPY